MSLSMESCSIEEVCAEFGVNEKVLEQLRNELEDWLKLQPHLPQDAVSKNRLDSFILGSKMSLEIAKQKLDLYYSIRGIAPELFADRDPRAPALTALHDVSQYVLLPKLTPEKYAVSVSRAIVNDPSRADQWQIMRLMLMVNDIVMDERRCSGQIYIFDLGLMGLGHLKNITPTLLQKYHMTTKAYPTRIKALHFINAPSFADRLVSMVKSFASPKLAARIHVHTSDDLDALYQFVPRSVLPKDYGGDQPSMDELAGMWRNKLEEWRDWFLEQNGTLVDEGLRPASSVDAESLFGSAGSFRKLDFD